jgi:putative PIN family toxin of toxin-antitoxin system
MLVLLDTNVLASGIFGLRSGSKSAPAQILRQWNRGLFDLLISEHILLELERTLSNRYFSARVSSGELRWHLRTLRVDAKLVGISVQVSGIATHPEDDLVIAAAVSGSADYLVTGDIQVLKLGTYRGVAIASPRAFLELLEQTNQLPGSSG